MIIQPRMPALLLFAVLLLLSWVPALQPADVFTFIEHVTECLLLTYLHFSVCSVNGSPITEACIDSNWWRRWWHFSNVFSKRNIPFKICHRHHLSAHYHQYSYLWFIIWQLFLLRAAGFLLPFYIMAWAISILQRRRHRQVSTSPPLYASFFSSLLLHLFGTPYNCCIATFLELWVQVGLALLVYELFEVEFPNLVFLIWFVPCQRGHEHSYAIDLWVMNLVNIVKGFQWLYSFSSHSTTLEVV